MYYLREMIGEEAVNRALRKVLQQVWICSLRRIRRRTLWLMPSARNTAAVAIFDQDLF